MTGLRRFLREIVVHRELVLLLVKRELFQRYRGSVLGFLWSFLNPLLYFSIYYVVFSTVMRIEIDHYPFFLFVGLLPWIWFSGAVLDGTNCILFNGSLIGRMKFPSIILPFVVVSTTFMNYLLSLPVLFVAMAVAGFPFGWAIVSLPVILLAQFILTLGIVLVLSALNVYYRDVFHLTNAFMPGLFFITPILYNHEMVPPKLRLLNYANPVALLEMAYREALFHQRFPPAEQLAASLAIGILSLLIGLRVFDHFRDTFAEEL